MPDTVTPAADCPHYMFSADANKGATRCRRCQRRLDNAVRVLGRARAQQILKAA